MGLFVIVTRATRVWWWFWLVRVVHLALLDTVFDVPRALLATCGVHFSLGARGITFEDTLVELTLPATAVDVRQVVLITDFVVLWADWILLIAPPLTVTANCSDGCLFATAHQNAAVHTVEHLAMPLAACSTW